MSKDWKEDVLAEVKAELEAMEAAGEEPKDVAELEQLTIKMTQKIGKKAFESWLAARAKRATFSP